MFEEEWSEKRFSDEIRGSLAEDHFQRALKIFRGYGSVWGHHIAVAILSAVKFSNLQKLQALQVPQTQCNSQPLLIEQVFSLLENFYSEHLSDSHLNHSRGDTRKRIKKVFGEIHGKIIPVFLSSM